MLLLDEPTMGMAPVAAREVRKLIGELRNEQRTILPAIHDMAEAESLCDPVSFVPDGAVVATRSPHAVAGLVSTAQGLELDGVDPALAAALAEVPGVTSITSITAIRGPASANMPGTRCVTPAARRTCAGLR